MYAASQPTSSPTQCNANRKKKNASSMREKRKTSGKRRYAIDPVMSHFRSKYTKDKQAGSNSVIIPGVRSQYVNAQAHPPRGPSMFHVAHALDVGHVALAQYVVGRHEVEVEVEGALEVTLRTGGFGEEFAGLQGRTGRKDDGVHWSGARAPRRSPHAPCRQDEFVWEVVWGWGGWRGRVHDDGDAAGVAGFAGVGEGWHAGDGAVGAGVAEEEVLCGDGPAGADGLGRRAHDGGPVLEGVGDGVADGDVLCGELLLAGLDEGHDAGLDPGVEARHLELVFSFFAFSCPREGNDVGFERVKIVSPGE